MKATESYVPKRASLNKREVRDGFMGYNYSVKILRQLPRWGVYVLLAYMPFHIFIATWMGSSLGGIDAWKISKDILTIVLFVFTACLVLLKVHRKEWRSYTTLIILAACYALLHIILYFINRSTSLEVAMLASTYNNRFIWVFLIGLGAGLLARKPTDQKQLIRFVLIVSTAVCVLGLLQWFLPSDVLTHFGYDKAIGVKPSFFINEDPAFPRVFATFRDPNSFGAYLIIPILILVQLIQKSRQKLLMSSLLGLHLIVLYLSFSRAAWLGLIIGLCVLTLLLQRQKTLMALKRFWPLLITLVIMGGGVVYGVRNTSTFRSIVLKADDKNASTEMDSDEYHLHFMKEGAKNVIDRPIGHGPGTAGIVSIHNGAEGQLTENYYVQIAHEVGVVGLAVFVAIWVIVIQMLLREKLSPLSTALIASAAAYAVMAMVMHLWTNEAVAIGWWGLAGLTISLGNSHNKTSKKRVIYS